MSGSASDYSSWPLHPTAAYADGGEITVALLRADADGEVDPDATWDGSGRVLARCLVWDDSENSGRKEFGRLYGLADNARALRTALEAQGYRTGDLSGARIAKIQAERGGANAFVMPYLDIGGGTVDDNGDHFEVCGDLSATRTDGLIYATEMAQCDHCGDNFPEDELSSVAVGRHDHESWCESCREYSTFYCQEAGETVADSCAASYYPSGSSYPETVAEWELEGTGAVQCDDGEWRVDAFSCADCCGTFEEDECHGWDGRETGDSSHEEGDSLCGSCHSDREEAADEWDAEQLTLALDDTDAAVAA